MYCQIDAVLSALQDDMIDAILGPEPVVDEADRMSKITPFCEQAINDADAEIDGYIGKRYKVPLASCPAVIGKMSKDIAVYNLASRTGIDENDRENTIYVRYKNAINYLTMVAKGTADIGIDQDTSSSGHAANGFRLSSSQRIFSRESMKGW